MGAFRYCECGEQGFDKPTARQDLVEYERQRCHCGNALDQYMTKREWIIDIDDRLRELEQKAAQP